MTKATIKLSNGAKNVLHALLDNALDVAGGDFGFTNEVNFKSMGMSRHQYGGYLAKLQSAGLVSIDSDGDKNTNGKTKGQFSFPDIDQVHRHLGNNNPNNAATTAERKTTMNTTKAPKVNKAKQQGTKDRVKAQAKQRVSDKAKQVKELLTKLQGAKDQKAKKLIRRKLRTLGHQGGLSKAA